jgi:gamma-glutamyl-gamma-aminobutyrate hydrolase PuuD
MPKKRIGLTQRVLKHKDREYDCIERSWYSVLENHTLFFIPNDLNFDLSNLDLDVLIITGGDNHPVRDQLEKKLIEKFLREDKPILGICHGAFELTKFLGGSVNRILNHMDVDHTVFYNDKEYKVNSFHSFCIDINPPESKILVTDQDNYCESWIKNKVSAIVWHPERMTTPFIPEEIKKVIFYDD